MREAALKIASEVSRVPVDDIKLRSISFRINSFAFVQPVHERQALPNLAEFPDAPVFVLESIALLTAPPHISLRPHPSGHMRKRDCSHPYQSR
jgi:hypothetical protein